MLLIVWPQVQLDVQTSLTIAGLPIAFHINDSHLKLLCLHLWLLMELLIAQYFWSPQTPTEPHSLKACCCSHVEHLKIWIKPSFLSNALKSACGSKSGSTAGNC